MKRRRPLGRRVSLDRDEALEITNAPENRPRRGQLGPRTLDSRTVRARAEHL